MTTVRRGASIDRAVTAGSPGQAEAELGRERQQDVARVGPLAPELEEAVLGRPVSVPDAQTARALDERRRPSDALARRWLGDGVEGLGNRAVHDESQGGKVEGQPERLRFIMHRAVTQA